MITWVVMEIYGAQNKILHQFHFYCFSQFIDAKMSNTYEQQSKVILERINQTEKNAKNLAHHVASVNRKEAK